MRISKSLRYCPLMLLLLLAACESAPPKQVIYSPPPAVVEEPEPVPAETESDLFRRARILADMLYAARMSYEDNRLMTPAGNNAYEQYREVLDIEPDNAVARQGMIDIALRYAELAELAISQGQYDNAASLLSRGERVQPGREELAAVRSRLAVARENKVDSFPLDPADLSAQSPAMQARLAEIAAHIRDQEATFLINARNDEEGRWIYKVMREAVEGYRLRGNIAIAGTPAIVITPMPTPG